MIFSFTACGEKNQESKSNATTKVDSKSSGQADKSNGDNESNEPDSVPAGIIDSTEEEAMAIGTDLYQHLELFNNPNAKLEGENLVNFITYLIALGGNEYIEENYFNNLTNRVDDSIKIIKTEDRKKIIKSEYVKLLCKHIFGEKITSNISFNDSTYSVEMCDPPIVDLEVESFEDVGNYNYKAILKIYDETGEHYDGKIFLEYFKHEGINTIKNVYVEEGKSSNNQSTFTSEIIGGETINYDAYKAVVIGDYNGKNINKLTELDRINLSYESEPWIYYNFAVFGTITNVKLLTAKTMDSEYEITDLSDEITNSLVTIRSQFPNDMSVDLITFIGPDGESYKISFDDMSDEIRIEKIK